jgi:hypothetical protein
MREDPTAEILVELTLDMPRQPAAVRVGVPQLGEQRLRVAGNQLVQHRALGRASTVAAQRLSGCAGRPFVDAASEHPPAR